MSLVIGESAVETIEYWQARALRAEARLAEVEAGWEADREKWSITVQALGKPGMSDRDNLNWVFLQWDIENKRQAAVSKGEDPPPSTPVSYTAIGDRRGLTSGDPISDSVSKFQDAGLLTAEVKKLRDKETGQVRSQAVINHGDESYTERMRSYVHMDPLKALPDMPRPGGKRAVSNLCQTCGSEETDMVCRSCGAVHDTAGIPSADSNSKVRRTQDIGTAEMKRKNTARNKSIKKSFSQAEDGDTHMAVPPPTRQLAPQEYVSTPLPGERTLIRQVAPSGATAQSFDPDSDLPEPPADLLYDDQPEQGEWAW